MTGLTASTRRSIHQRPLSRIRGYLRLLGSTESATSMVLVRPRGSSDRWTPTSFPNLTSLRRWLATSRLEWTDQGDAIVIRAANDPLELEVRELDPASADASGPAQDRAKRTLAGIVEGIPG